MPRARLSPQPTSYWPQLFPLAFSWGYLSPLLLDSGSFPGYCSQKNSFIQRPRLQTASGGPKPSVKAFSPDLEKGKDWSNWFLQVPPEGLPVCLSPLSPVALERCLDPFGPDL